jgi:hypothetical protein
MRTPKVDVLVGVGALVAAAVVAPTALGDAPNPAGCKAPAKFKSAKYAAEVASTYVRYCEVCFVIGYKTIHHDYKLTATDPKKIAVIYVKHDERGDNRISGTEGCLRGFALRGKP